MKKYLIQDVNDRKFLCEDNTWSELAEIAIDFKSMQEATEIAIKINKEHGYPLTVVIVIA